MPLGPEGDSGGSDLVGQGKVPPRKGSFAKLVKTACHGGACGRVLCLAPVLIKVSQALWPDRRGVEGLRDPKRALWESGLRRMWGLPSPKRKI